MFTSKSFSQYHSVSLLNERKFVFTKLLSANEMRKSIGHSSSSDSTVSVKWFLLNASSRKFVVTLTSLLY